MLKLVDKYDVSESVAYIIKEKKQIKKLSLLPGEIEYVEKRFDEKNKFIHINSFYKSSFFIVIDEAKNFFVYLEEIRQSGTKISNALQESKIESINIVDLSSGAYSLALAEGIILSNYRFNKYFSDRSDRETCLKEIKLVKSGFSDEEIKKFHSVITGVFHARDIVNEPLSFMTAKKLSEEAVAIGKQYGVKTEVLDKKKIESLKMGGILAVNRGSIEPPTFTIMKWEPENAINKKPFVLVGKGLVFDTGGINLKPSGYLETMKSDKAGGAAVIGAISAIAKAELPIKIIGLIPATENRPGNNAYVPEDIIEMYDGTTVEVLNTDAEGRLILADALAYAKKFDPQLVIDLATLTGAAVTALGEHVTAIMGNDADNIEKLKNSGFKTWEKLVEFPLWDEYAEQLKSTIADMKNIGGKYAGTITAGKFLEHFTNYNWIHLDIAGPAFTEKQDTYRGVGGTGVGVRLLFNFFAEYCKQTCS
ncbi:leucyl aminopeptidase [Bacteroidales bacterium OttesenSCG-928-I21]|nr:leucyl aminopeptidase [Bacteroidales bacterium OttesenSCG-928-I21]